MPITLRPGDADDAEAVTAIINVGAPEPAAVEQVRERLQGALAPAANRYITRLVAVDDAGRVTGYGHALREDWMDPGLFWVHIAVAPDARHQGIGAALYTTLRAWSAAHGATNFLGEARDNLEASHAFAVHCGFQRERHIFESTLDLRAFDETPFTHALDGSRAAGLRFLTMADAGDTPDARRALWELERTIGRDIPGGSEATVMPFETYSERFLDAPGYDAALQFIAADGPGEHATWVGLARCEVPAESDGYYNGVTGVLPAWRNRGIALALKLLMIRAAKARGAPYLRTNNDSENHPMLAVNRKLGYHAEPGYERMRAYLTAGG